MAKPNKLGTSYLGLDLEEHEEKIMQNFLIKKGWSAKRWLRSLIRKELNLDVKLNVSTNEKTGSKKIVA